MRKYHIVIDLPEDLPPDWVRQRLLSVARNNVNEDWMDGEPWIGAIHAAGSPIPIGSAFIR